MTGSQRSRWKPIAGFAALTLIAVGGAGVYLAKALLHGNRVSALPAAATLERSDLAPAPTSDRVVSPAIEPPRPVKSAAPRVTPAPATVPRDQPLPSASPREAPTIMFRITAMGESHGSLGLVDLAARDRTPTTTSLRCERLHFMRDRGVCLAAERGMFATYGAVVFDRSFQSLHQLRLNGSPSRVRVAPDGQHAAVTVFISGHSYATTDFSTQTTFIDLRTGDVVIQDMESFTVWRNEDRFKSSDFNFWGVTFTRDSNRFYATLGTGGRTYLVEGDLARREARVVREGVECPALSPDNRHVAFKKRTGGLLTAVTWRLSVLDLASGKDWELAETRSVDDQVEWLNDQTVMYGLIAAPSGTAVTNVWTVPGDGTGAPVLLLQGAASPTVVARESDGQTSAR